ncbi:FUSC family protein [Streptomyces sp. NPDC056883]|uniref:FUSC family protein n=1 Tax=Streptomyces sp. NPDC056883 TaxID=3345959 RepID=UPI003680A3BF
MVGDLIGRALPFGHGYWVPLVAVLILRPGFSHTYGRAAARLGGTVFGLIISGTIVQLAHPGPLASGTLSVICGGLILLFMYTGYAPVQAAGSAYTVFALPVAGVGLDQSLPEARRTACCTAPDPSSSPPWRNSPPPWNAPRPP